MILQLHPASRLNRRIKRYVEATGKGQYPDIELTPDLLDMARLRAKAELDRAKAEVRFLSAVAFFAERDIRTGGNGNHAA